MCRINWVHFKSSFCLCFLSQKTNRKKNAVLNEWCESSTDDSVETSTEGFAQMTPTILIQSNSVSTSRVNTAIQWVRRSAICQRLCYVRKSVISGRKKLLKKNVVQRWKSLVGKIEKCFKRTKLSLRENARNALPVHQVMLHFSRAFCIFLINHGHTLIALLPEAVLQRSTDDEDTVAVLKQSDLPVFDVVLIFK